MGGFGVGLAVQGAFGELAGQGAADAVGELFDIDERFGGVEFAVEGGVGLDPSPDGAVDVGGCGSTERHRGILRKMGEGDATPEPNRGSKICPTP